MEHADSLIINASKIPKQKKQVQTEQITIYSVLKKFIKDNIGEKEIPEYMIYFERALKESLDMWRGRPVQDLA